MISLRPAYDPLVGSSIRSAARVGASECPSEGLSVAEDGSVYTATPECPGYPGSRPTGSITRFGYGVVAGLTALGGAGGYYTRHALAGAVSGAALGLAAVFVGGYDYYMRTKFCCFRDQDGRYRWVEKQSSFVEIH